MATALLNVLAVFSGALTIAGYAQSNWADKPGEGSTYKFAVGLDGTKGANDKELNNAGGDLPDIRVWDDNIEFVGMKADPGKIKSGNLEEVNVKHDHQGTYTLFSANNDAICIAWVAVTWSDKRGGNRYALSGDLAAECGATWYYSGMYYNEEEDWGAKKPEELPRCFWIDKDGDHEETGFQVRWPSFSNEYFKDEESLKALKKEMFCDDVSFGIKKEEDPKKITHYTDGFPGIGGQEKLRKRRFKKRSEALSSQLVIANQPSHSARHLCEAEGSKGPDFVNTEERIFCDMDEKTVYEFCGEGVDGTCYDEESQSLRVQGAGTMGVSSSRTYTRTTDWRKN